MENGTNTPKILAQAYEPPLLVQYGDLVELTRAVGNNSTTPDGNDNGSKHKTR